MSERPTTVNNVTGLMGMREMLEALLEGAERLLNSKSAKLDQPLMFPPGAPKVTRAILLVKQAVKEIEKTGWNAESKYKFVEWAVLSAKLQDQMVAAGLVLAQREMARVVVGKTLFITYQYDAYWTDKEATEGQYILNLASNTGACRFEFKSGTTDDKAANKCQTAGLKTACISLFKIAADVADIERDDVGLPEADRRRERDGGDRRGSDEDRRPPPPADPRQPPDDRREPDRRSAASPGPSNWNPPGDSRGSWGNDHAGPGWEPPPAGGSDDYGGGPPPEDPPFGEPGRPAPAPNSPEEVGFRRDVQTLQQALAGARDEPEAAEIWTRNASTVREMNDNTYEFFRAAYVGRWNLAPPRT